MPTSFTREQRTQLLGFLSTGNNNAKNASSIAAFLGFPTGGNQVKTRKLMTECIDIDGDLIGSTLKRPKGYFIISFLVELDNYLDTLENRAKEINDRRSSLIRNWNNNYSTSPTSKRLKRY